MREIKFRAWETTLSEMIPVFNIDFEKKLINRNSAWRTFGEIEMMQYTGRKDNTGIELYEGDIVEENDELSVCVWMDEAGAFLFVPAYLYPCDLTTLTTNHGNDTFFDNDSPEIYVKIIGNIHEHPHLLETKK